LIRRMIAGSCLLLLAGCGEPETPLTQALKVCGDTPTPTVWETVGSGRFSSSVPHLAESSQYALQVQSVDACRKAVLDYFKKEPQP
jgi:hypothetical protein